ncbi:MAG: nucleoside hydrolase [Rhodoferax sp.]|nr:nucleoside hydrolase [Rhodoferax sp.]
MTTQPPPAFPLRRRDAAWYRDRLVLPAGRLRVVIDTDAANEIDDQFALAWLLLSRERFDLQGVYAGPFSFEYRRQEMLRARRARDNPSAATQADLDLLHQHADQIAEHERKGVSLESMAGPIFQPPAVGMERSHAEILTVFDRMGIAADGLVHRGATGYLSSATDARSSAATDHLIRTARATRPGDTLDVIALGCVTNIAHALLLAPDIIDRVVVVWTSGFPSHAPQVNYAFNLEQDMVASTVLLDSGVPLVYLPGYHVGAQLRLSLPDMQAYVRGRGAIGDYLYHLFTHNPLWEFLGIDSLYAHSWVIWDVINVAWLLNPAWVPSSMVTTPVLGADRRWYQTAGRHPMREAHGVARDAIFRDFFQKLERAAS